MAKQIVRITENELKRIVNESVNKVLNEMSSDVLFNAGEKAYNQGRTIQGGKFNVNARRQQKQELGITDKFWLVDKSNLGFTDIKGVKHSIDYEGNLHSNYGNNINAMDGFHYLDKSTARAVAKWVSKYVVDSNEGKERASDWHFWARL